MALFCGVCFVRDCRVMALINTDTCHIRKKRIEHPRHLSNLRAVDSAVANSDTNLADINKDVALQTSYQSR